MSSEVVCDADGDVLAGARTAGSRSVLFAAGPAGARLCAAEGRVRGVRVFGESVVVRAEDATLVYELGPAGLALRRRFGPEVLAANGRFHATAAGIFGPDGGLAQAFAARPEAVEAFAEGFFVRTRARHDEVYSLDAGRWRRLPVEAGRFVSLAAGHVARRYERRVQFVDFDQVVQAQVELGPAQAFASNGRILALGPARGRVHELFIFRDGTEERRLRVAIDP